MNAERDIDRLHSPVKDATTLHTDESLVRDARAGLTPAQMVERKLVSLLQSAPLMVSRLQGGVRRPLS